MSVTFCYRSPFRGGVWTISRTPPLRLSAYRGTPHPYSAQPEGGATLPWGPTHPPPSRLPAPAEWVLSRQPKERGSALLIIIKRGLGLVLRVRGNPGSRRPRAIRRGGRGMAWGEWAKEQRSCGGTTNAKTNGSEVL